MAEAGLHCSIVFSQDYRGMCHSTVQTRPKPEYGGRQFSQDRIAHHRRSPQVSHSCNLLYRQLAEDGEHEVLQQAVLEDIHGSRLETFGKRAAAKYMIYWWPHLQEKFTQGLAASPADMNVAGESRYRALNALKSLLSWPQTCQCMVGWQKCE